ncbi:transcription factor subunit Med10 of mediator complex-domain-containing protein [Microdochium trichocladiopsis]|uniref:Mediator of RNA polymerase II transcription subunit 10 n=1 Tax=Microdochium trichocladiopsis TaxID=1682393 RepID=A0A9P8YHF5_9PEZI|nr:transcription factor subunit Med10 of mediator complex-domain-containing protein [Microdochium trichocladiopsis]KAH7038205.1 transcription factor subunit Med10 of mediator complex-domain-containing protein [Microdochium trichocladiopsis]
MAPAGRMGAADHDVIEQQLKETVQSLYNILVQVSAYDQHTSVSSSGTTPSSGGVGNSNNNNNTPPTTSSASANHPTSSSSSSSKPSAEVLAQELRTLSQSLQAIHQTASTPDPEHSLPHIPPELVQYVENGRNPDIYTREFVEQVRRGNQLLRGKQVAFGRFRDILADSMDSAMPELRDDVSAVLEATGGKDRWKSQQQQQPQQMVGSSSAVAVNGNGNGSAGGAGGRPPSSAGPGVGGAAATPAGGGAVRQNSVSSGTPMR